MVNLGEKRWCNFRTRGAKPAKGKTAREKRPGMSDAHLAAIRKLPCCACGRIPAGTVHHLKQNTGERGMGLRATDKWGVPLCQLDHDMLERQGSRNELAWFTRYGIDDPPALADALWHASPDAARMTRIVIEHRGK